MRTVAKRQTATRIVRRARRAGVDVPETLLSSLEHYLALLARWNQRINLTALPLEPPSDEAVDRLVVEPLVAVRRLRPEDRLAVDIGSGGGSPSIPMRLAAPALRFVLVEVKVRKAAFLREAARELALDGVEVENRRFEELLARSDLHEAADVVTLRAVRADRRLWRGFEAVLRPGGRVFWFSSGSREHDLSFNQIHSDSLTPASAARLLVLERPQR
jgi:16S rRNA (guanine(527)-N(7))-methyltransferase RsmG